MNKDVTLLISFAGHRVVKSLCTGRRHFQNKGTHRLIKDVKLQSPQLVKRKYGRRINRLTKIHCIRYYTSTSLLSFQTVKQWCTGMAQRDGMGREEGGGFGMGSTCIPVADSF